MLFNPLFSFLASEEEAPFSLIMLKPISLHFKMPSNLEKIGSGRGRILYAFFYMLSVPSIKPVLILQGKTHFPRWVLNRHSWLMKDNDFM